MDNEDMDEVMASRNELMAEEGEAQVPAESSAEGRGKGAGLSYGRIRFGKLAKDLVLSVPPERISALCDDVERATGAARGKSTKKVPYLVKALESNFVKAIPKWKRSELATFLAFLDAPTSGSHARLCTRALEVMLGADAGFKEPHYHGRKSRALRSAKLPGKNAPTTVSLGAANPNELFNALAAELKVDLGELEAAEEGAGAGGPEDKKAARHRANTLHTLADQIAAAAEDATEATRHLIALKAALEGTEVAPLVNALQIGPGMDNALNEIGKIATNTAAASIVVADAFKSAAAQAGMKAAGGRVSRSKRIAHALYEKLHEVEGRSKRSLEGESEAPPSKRRKGGEGGAIPTAGTSQEEAAPELDAQTRSRINDALAEYV